MPELKFTWVCPKCSAPANEHGKRVCIEREGNCMGFICDCDEDTGEHHGEVLSDPCTNANCYHCGWGGTFPVKPKGLQAWEKKAMEAGWSPPEKRRKELGGT